MELLEVRDAARRLGVSTRQVQNLVARGDLTGLSRGVVDARSVERFLAVHGRTRTRPWSTPTAWGAVAILSEVPATWMGQTQRSRLTARLRDTTAAHVLAQTRVRAECRRFGGHPSARARVSTEIVDTVAAAARLGLGQSTDVNGYVSSDALGELSRRFALVPDDAGGFMLRATTFRIEIVRELAGAAPVLAALDLAESLDVRERRAGLDALASALEKLRG